MTTPATGSDPKPSIYVGSDAEAIRALTTALDTGALPDVYVTGGGLVHLARESGHTTDTGGHPLPTTAAPLTPAGLAWLLAHHTYCHTIRDDKKTETSPKATTLSAVLSHRHWSGVPPLLGVIGSPVLRPDGTLVQEPGYDQATGLYYAPATTIPPIPTRPTPADVDDAASFVLDRLVCDFPFVADADRANGLGLLLAPILRPYLRALTPFGLISATTQSSGKTLLAEILGHLYGSKNLVWRRGDDAELEKSITSALHSPAPVLLWDNLAEGSIISSAVLAQLLTSPEWSARMLGSSGDGFTTTNNRVWLATGNNIRLGGDMATRTVLIRLDPNDPHPDQRDQTRFGIPHLDTWLKEPTHRTQVLRHLLVLVMDWINNNAPRSTHSMRQFTTWAQATGGLLAHHGISGFLDNLGDLRETDDDNQEWASFLACWHTINDDRPVSARKLRMQAEIDMVNGRPVDRWEGTFLTDDLGRAPSAKSLGRTLTGHIGRWHGNHVLRSGMDPRANARVFWVERRNGT
ncbi:hypothetical protein [Actinokineospora inagensis]|uniref:hypothetical protein n=1 Tax=Actinokineospora inagensis TaxID=103730 RepID=UPI00041DA2A1|nr:hypothetical protein [Actinokineospora inagensis]